MRQAILPFLFYVLLQSVVLTVGCCADPLRKEANFSALLSRWIFGQMILFGILQVLAIPMILMRLPFDALFWSFCGITFCLFCGGIMRFLKDGPRWRLRQPLNKSAVILWAFALLLILFQFMTYFMGRHLDEDDARWLAEANDALEYGHMMTVDFDTGEKLEGFVMFKDVTSPWPMMYAILSRILGTRASIFAHSIYAPLELLLMYGVYFLMAEELFEKQEARAGFLFLVAVIHLVYGGTVYTQGTFSLVRIWQGKASVAGVIIPLLLCMFLRIHNRDRLRDWIMLVFICAASSLMSGMGISLSAIMIGVYGAYDIAAYRRLRRIPLLIAALSPAAASALVYFLFRR